MPNGNGLCHVGSVETEHPAIREARRLRQQAERLTQMLGATVHGLREDRAAAQRAAEAVADTLAGIRRFDNDSSPPSSESRYPVLGVRVASARNTRTSSGE